MGSDERLMPREARTAGEFVALMRRLKERSGLTYRQMEERAAERGEVLARSTLADVLGGKRLPRPELLAAFVRACGDGDRVEVWLRARASLAERAAVEPPAPTRSALLGWRFLPVWLAASLVLGAAGWMLFSAYQPGSEQKAGTVLGVSSPSPSRQVRIRPAMAPHLCLTDGLVRDGRYPSLVAVQRPCGEVAPQITVLEPVFAGHHQIQWHHPEHGKGCLKALAEGPAAGLLEPWDACDQASYFRIEPAGASGYVLRVDGQGCVGISDTNVGTGAVMGDCLGPGQVFLIDADI